MFYILNGKNRKMKIDNKWDAWDTANGNALKENGRQMWLNESFGGLCIFFFVVKEKTILDEKKWKYRQINKLI